MTNDVRPDEAAGALDEIARRRAQVVDSSIVPAGFWWATSALMVRRAQPRTTLLGPAGVLAILGFVAAVLAVSLPTSFALDAAGVRYPATIGILPTAVCMVVGGPLLMRYLRRLMLTHRTGGGA
jgi:hypothetical protein